MYSVEPSMSDPPIDASTDLFEGEISMTSAHPDSLASWQVSWIFSEGEGIHAGQVADAILINPGGPGGHPARAVNLLEEDALEGGVDEEKTSSFTFTGYVPRGSMAQNLVQVAVNGVLCTSAVLVNGAEGRVDDACARREYSFCCGSVMHASLSPPPPLAIVEQTPPPVSAQVGVIAQAASNGTSWLRNGSTLSAFVIACVVAAVFIAEISRRIVSRFIRTSSSSEVCLTQLGEMDFLRKTKRKRSLPLPGQCFNVSRDVDLDGVVVRDDTARTSSCSLKRSADSWIDEETPLFITPLASYLGQTDGEDASGKVTIHYDADPSPKVLEINLNSLKLERLIGQGAFGAVYAARWNKRVVAVKKLHAVTTSSKSDMKSFVREVAVLSSIRHPKIIRMFGACLKLPQLCIVEELMERGSLHDFLHGPTTSRRRELSVEETLRIAMDVAQAMEYLHFNAIVHRDLKSHNVLLHQDGAKVCDFGIARALERTLLSDAATRTSASRATAGTPAWMAPELFHDEAVVTTSCDVYSFSVLIWELLARETPWDWLNNHMQIIFAVAIQSQRLPLDRHDIFTRADDDEISALVDEIMVPCWQTDPGSRPNFTDVVFALRRLLERRLRRNEE
jgi:tRNA A-37 threonylcarbamoyl transferase component Bud32